MLSKLIKKSKDDNGNAVVVLGIMLIASLLLVGGMMLDISKAYQMKSSYLDAAKKATQASIREQTSEGYLKPEAIGLAIDTYENITRPSVINVDGAFAMCSDYKPEDVSLTVTLRNEKGGTLPIPSIKRTDAFGSDYKSITKEIIDDSLRREISKGKYTEILLEVQEGTENTVLPGAFLITQSDKEKAANIKCQKMKVAARANIFQGAEAGTYN